MPVKSKRKILKFWTKFKPFFFVFLLIFLLWESFFFLRPLLDFAKKNDIGPTFLYSLFFSKEPFLKKEKGRTNLLLLGVSGGDNQANDLTDTMIFLSFNFEKKKALLASLLRDIWSPTLRDKINSAYHYGEEKKEGGGLILAKLIAEETLGQPIHYAFLIDFSSFKEAIDVLGGIDIEVERSFNDFQFPIKGKEDDLCDGDPELSCRYEHVYFKKGWQKMSGETALKYVRSRNAEDEEGGDFARAARQQKLLLAFKGKFFSSEVVFNPFKIKKLIEVLSKGIKTDIKLAEACFLGKFGLGLEKSEVKKLVLEESLFIIPPLWQYGKWVLIPPNEDFTPIHQYVEKQLENL